MSLLLVLPTNRALINPPVTIPGTRIMFPVVLPAVRQPASRLKRSRSRSAPSTGGSIRQPAAFCGVVGLKPTYGRVSRLGLIAFSSSLDCPGPISRDVRDSALMLQAMAGVDPKDSTSSTRPVDDYLTALGQDVKGLRIGLSPDYDAVYYPDLKPVNCARKPSRKKFTIRSIAARNCWRKQARRSLKTCPCPIPHTVFRLICDLAG